MRPRHFHMFVPVAVCAALILLLAAPDARAAGLVVSPQSGTRGTSFQFRGSGFTPTETVALWVNFPDGQVVGQGNTQADQGGSVSFSVTPDATYPYGYFVEVAHGISSQYEVTAGFSLGSIRSRSHGGQNVCANGSFLASGYTPGETVATWTTRPDGVSVALPNVSADANGVVSFTFMPQTGWPAGPYIVVALGYSSKYQGVNNFNWDGANLAGGKCLNQDQSVSNSGPTTKCGSGNFAAAGFISGETVATWTTRPDGVSVALPSASADENGVVTFTFMPQPGWPAGPYIVVALGYSSKYQGVNNFNWDGANLTGGNCKGKDVARPPLSLVVPGSIVVSHGPGVYLGNDPNRLYYFDCGWKWRSFGSNIYFLVLGFKPFEQVGVSYQIMNIQPDLKPYATINADGNGNAAFSINTFGMPSGHYHWWFSSASASYCGHYDH
jgi:hypothetical protein